MVRTLALAATICASLTTPTAACTDDMAMLSQALTSPTLTSEFKLRLRGHMVHARERQSVGDIAGCATALQPAKRMLGLPAEALRQPAPLQIMRS